MNNNGSKQKKSSNGQKKAKGGAKINLRQATSSLKVYQPSNLDGPVRSVPAAMGSKKSVGRPSVRGSSNGDCRIVHREYISDVSMTAAFLAAAFSMNPGLAAVFPWLSSIAARFESYRFRKLRFCFETSCSSTQTGAVLLVPDYDASDAAPTSKSQALSYRSAARAQPWLSFCQDSLPEDISKRKSYYVRQGSLAAAQDIKLYDTGTLFLCTQGSDTNTIGEFWVEYDIDLMTPQTSGSVLSALFANGGVVSDTAIFGTTPVITGTLPVSGSGNQINFNAPYEGLIGLQVAGTGLLAPVLGGNVQVGVEAEAANAAGNLFVGIYTVRAQPGQNVSWDFTTSTTVTGAAARLGNYTFSLG